MIEKLSPAAQLVANSYRKISQERTQQAETLDLARTALLALLSPQLSEEARYAVFKLMLETKGDDTATLDGKTNLTLQISLGRAESLITSLQESAEGSATKAEENARWVEEHDLRNS